MNIWALTKPLVDWKWPFLTTVNSSKSKISNATEALLGNAPQLIGEQKEMMCKDITSNHNNKSKDEAITQEQIQQVHQKDLNTDVVKADIADASDMSANVEGKHTSTKTTITLENGEKPTVHIHPPLHVNQQHSHHKGYGHVNAHGHHTGRRKPTSKTYQPPYHDAGAYIELAHGLTYYELHGFEGEGSQDKEIVVLLHGLSWWSFTWELMVPHLMANNYRVITFDFYGRGLSAAPRHLKYDNELLASQTHELLTKLNLGRKVTMVGFSMGGGVAGTFASKYHDMLNKLVLIGPVGTPVQMPLAAKVLAIPMFGWCIYWAFAKLAMQRSLKTDQCKSDFVKPEKVAHLLGRYVDYSEWCIESKEGFFEALYSTTMNFPFSDLLNVYNKIPSTVPVLLLWGEKDHLVPVKNHKLVLGAIPHAQFISIPDAGHTCFLEEPDLIHKHITDFISTIPQPSTQQPTSQHNKHNRSHGPHFFHRKPVHVQHPHQQTHAFHTLALNETTNTNTEPTESSTVPATVTSDTQ